MKKIFVVLLSVAVLTAANVASAQAEPVVQDKTILFHWYMGTSPDWPTGGLYALCGLAGALITIFSVIGSVVPGTAGKARLDSDQSRLDRYSNRLEELSKLDPPDTEAIKALTTAIANLRKSLRSERWQQFWVGFALYTLLGAFFATAVAQTLAQAVVLGAGWTSFLGVFGLKSDFTVRKEAKDEILGKAEQVLAAIETDLQKSVGSEGSVDTVNLFDIPDFRGEIRAARSL